MNQLIIELRNGEKFCIGSSFGEFKDELDNGAGMIELTLADRRKCAIRTEEIVAFFES